MDFGTLLHTAKKNEVEKPEVKYYSTKFAPPKKEKREPKHLSANIQKFLARKEAEEKRRAEEERKKREELLALRSQDKKATRRVHVMLKRTKSANQSVIADAVDKDNTAVTLVGPSQPDEDDYGYVSQEAAAFYNKMMEKYSKMPDEPKFKSGKKRVSGNLNMTKDRVRVALEREKEEALLPHRRKRKREEDEEEKEERNESSNKSSDKSKSRAAAPGPPPLNFNELLKLAAKKQHEPILIEAKPKDDTPLLTKKQKKQQEMERQWREGREARDREKLAALKQGNGVTRIPKINSPQETPTPEKPRIPKVNENAPQKSTPPVANRPTKPKPPSVNAPKVATAHSTAKPSNVDNRKPDATSNGLRKPVVDEKSKKPFLDNRNGKVVPKKPLEESKPKQFPPKDVRPRPFPPADMRRPMKKKPVANSRRILDDDDEDYDSEMDDFIDDGPGEGEDYSRYIKDIFGYDKSKYRGLDDDVDNMESTFAQQMREDVRSTKIGIMEDLQDMMQEKEEKKRKYLKKKGKL